MSNTLYVSDLDGTLLNDDAKLSSFTRQALCTLLDNGVAFTAASARSVKSIQPIFTDVPMRLPVIEFNGAFISDINTHEHLVTQAFEQNTLDYIHNTLKAHDQNYVASTFDGTQDRLYYSHITNPCEEWYINARSAAKDPRLTKVDDIHNRANEQAVCFTIIDREAPLVALQNKMGASDFPMELHLQENHYFKEWYWLTCHSPHANKANALSALRDIATMPDATIVAFGDNTNDIDMMRKADIGIAVGNAVDDVKSAADEVIDSSETDAVVRYIAEREGITLATS